MAGHWAVRDEVRIEVNVSVVTGILHNQDCRMPSRSYVSSHQQLQLDMSAVLESGMNSDVDIFVHVGNYLSLFIFRTHPIFFLTHNNV